MSGKDHGVSASPTGLSQVEPASGLAGFATSIPDADCACHTCTIATGKAQNWLPLDIRWMRYFLCPTCGNKRCPHATWHGHKCTGSNVPGQPGSSYGSDALTPDEFRNLLRDMAQETGNQRKLAARLGIHEEIVHAFMRGSRPAMPKLLSALGFAREWRYVPAQTIEARSAETVGLGPKDESVVGETDAPTTSHPTPETIDTMAQERLGNWYDELHAVGTCEGSA